MLIRRRVNYITQVECKAIAIGFENEVAIDLFTYENAKKWEEVASNCRFAMSNCLIKLVIAESHELPAASSGRFVPSRVSSLHRDKLS